MKAENRYDSLFQYYAEEYQLDWNLLKIQAQHESGPCLDPDAVSPVGAKGACQFMTATFAEWVVKLKIKRPNPFNPEHSIQCQAAMMRWLFNYFNGDTIKVLAGYNWGCGNVGRLGEEFALEKTPRETRVYVSNILSAYKRYA